MPHEAELNVPAVANGTLSVPVIRKHHLLVRLSHWLNVPFLFGLIGSGISIYWASPVYLHKPDPTTGNFDFVADIGIWICGHVPGLKGYVNLPDWVYNHFSLGPGMLAPALRLHFLFAYLFIINGAIYVMGLLVGGGWRVVLPRRSDPVGAFRMFRYYCILPFAKWARREWRPPFFDSLYNPLQRAAYFSIPVAGFLSAATGWAIHQPMQLHWLAVIFGGRIGLRRSVDSPRGEWVLNNAMRIDDEVAAALYSENRLVPTYPKSQITPLKNNYNGATPDPGYISGWTLALDGLDSGMRMLLDIRTLMTRFPLHDQITRFVCIEGWSSIAWWSGLNFADLLHAFPPKPQAKWAQVESSVNLDAGGSPDPYFVAIDLATARHPQTLLATHHNGQPLTVDHGAPLRLLAPVKLGLKNVKAVTRITYSADPPRDYWAERGYSLYNGI
jgi:DMSO/TMAO reductase YedYZ molybdopterin-dependent catalytic subunit/thiosulfate reductase cytochrome b subunit